MKKYWYLYKNHLATLFEYRSDLVFSLLTEMIALIGIIIYWSAVFRDNISVGGFKLGDMLAYYLLLPLIYLFTNLNMSDFIGKDIKDGVLSNYLVKPFFSQFYYITKLLAKRTVNLVLMVPFYILPFFYLAGLNLFVPSLSGIFGCFVIVTLTLFLYGAFDFFVGYSGFWVEDVWAFRHIKDIIVGSLGGLSFPLSIIQNSTFAAVVNFLPFKYIFFVPMNYLLGKVPLTELPKDILIMLLWGSIFSLMAFILWKFGLRKYEAFGK